jgi:hypothetical protein
MDWGRNLSFHCNIQGGGKTETNQLAPAGPPEEKRKNPWVFLLRPAFQTKLINEIHYNIIGKRTK